MAEEKTVKKRGGARPGAGRKKGGKNRRDPAMVVKVPVFLQPPEAPELHVKRPNVEGPNVVPDNHSFSKEANMTRMEFERFFSANKVLPIPECLEDPNAKLMWQSVMNAYAETDFVTLSKLDTGALILFCDAWGDYCQAKAEEKTLGGRKSSIDTAEAHQLSQILKVKTESRKTMIQLMKQLWLSADARADMAKRMMELYDERKAKEDQYAQTFVANY